MKIARHWARGQAESCLPSGKTFPVVAWGWSESTHAEALERATQNARRAAQWLTENWNQKARGQYYSVERPPREEIIREITDTSGEVIALITRNAYGALVLSTARLMFIDVDIPPEKTGAGLQRKVLGFFGKTSETNEERVEKQVMLAAENHRSRGLRLYRTRGGFRVLVTGSAIEPNSAQSTRLLQEFGADPLYVTLCRNQESYRARLSPKHWRMGVKRPPHRFPYEAANEQNEQRLWESEYSARAETYATCRFIQQFGARGGDAELQSLIELHDKTTKANSDLKLA